MPSEKFALVTGGGVGIGKASALALARAGWNVAIAGRRRELLEATAREIEALGRRALAGDSERAAPQRFDLARRRFHTPVSAPRSRHSIPRAPAPAPRPCRCRRRLR